CRHRHGTGLRRGAHEHRHCRCPRPGAHGQRHEEGGRSRARSLARGAHSPQVLQRRSELARRRPAATAQFLNLFTDAMIPNTLTIAGVDPSGGAGILADIKAMSALGAYGTAVVAALTAQNTLGVTDIAPVAPGFVATQIDTPFADVRIDAVKIGMLGQQTVTRVVAERMAHWKPTHLVLDPVMIAKSGHALLEREAISALRERLVPQATTITRNLPEAGVLLDRRPVESVKELPRTAERLRRLLADHDRRWGFRQGAHPPGTDT